MQQESINKDSALEMRFKQLKKYMTLGLVGVLVLCSLMFIYMSTLKQSESTAQTNAQVQSQIVIDSEVCKVYPDQELCVLAREIAANPDEVVVPKDGEDGKDGGNGKDGRGVTKFDTASGKLIVTYTDNSTQDLGRIVGKDGAEGKAGKDGRGIVATDIVSGSLIISYSDGTRHDAGIIVGPKGATGETGATGATGATGETGKDGAPGAPGLTPTSIDTDPFGTVSVTYNDGSVQTAGRIILPSVEIFQCSEDGQSLTLKLTNGDPTTIPMDCTPDNLPGPPAT